MAWATKEGVSPRKRPSTNNSLPVAIAISMAMGKVSHSQTAVRLVVSFFVPLSRFGLIDEDSTCYCPCLIAGGTHLPKPSSAEVCAVATQSEDQGPYGQ